MKEIFQNFDSDGNGMLEMDEFLDMFVGTYIHSEQVQEGSQMNRRFKVPKYIYDKQRFSPDELESLKEWLLQQFTCFYQFVTK